MTHFIQSTDAKRLLKDNKYVFIDVRSPSEFETSHIPGSYNLPLDEIENHKDDLKKLDKELIVICRSGNRAQMACSKLENIKKEHMKVLDGGILSWSQHQFQLKNGKKRWELERQVRLVAGGLAFIGAILGFLVNPMWHILSGFVGFGLFFAAATNTCMMGYVFSKLPYNRGYNYKSDLNKLFN